MLILCLTAVLVVSRGNLKMKCRQTAIVLVGNIGIQMAGVSFALKMRVAYRRPTFAILVTLLDIYNVPLQVQLQTTRSRSKATKRYL